MDEESYDNIESINDATEEVENTEEVEETATVVETEDESEDEGLDPDLIEKNKKLYERAKKAEAELKAIKSKTQVKAEPSQKQDGLSPLDTIAFIDAKVTNKEDIEVVQKYARLEGISIDEALKSTVVKSILAEKAEQRQTAEATSAGSPRRGSVKLTSEQILNNASKGKFLDDPEALAEAHMASKLKK